ncbi:MAG: hypothetical protein LBL96_08225 [Clostridiales bacterium]|jgi:uncharacterized membrane protein YkvI|nr:hypothetical protein [Clostridiales bacterium]
MDTTGNRISAQPTQTENKVGSTLSIVSRIVGVYISVIIGAGFASGQELMQFFAGYGVLGILGLALAGALFAATAWSVLDICFQQKITSHSELLRFVLGERLGFLIEMIVGFFLCVLFTAMIAGAGATGRQVFDAPFFVGAAITVVLTFTALLFDLDGLVAINARIAPFLAAGGLVIGFLTFFEQTRPVFAQEVFSNWLISSLIYASYNIVTSISVLAAMSSMITKRKQSSLIGLWSGVIMTLLGFAMIYPLYLHYAEVKALEIPLLVIATRHGRLAQYMYLILLLGAILTTAVSNGFAIVKWIEERFLLPPLLVKILISLLGLAAAHVGFSTLVARIYPIFSIVGLFETGAILLCWFRHRKSKAKGNQMPVAGKR